MSKVKSYGLKTYVSKAFGLDVGSRIKRTKRGEEEKEHIYEVKQLFSILCLTGRYLRSYKDLSLL